MALLGQMHGSFLLYFIIIIIIIMHSYFWRLCFCKNT